MIRRTRVDTTLSAIITEASTFPPEATAQDPDDQRQGVYPLRIYEGWNYLPTHYGVKSYFGLNSTLDASGLPAGLVVEDIFVYQTRAYSNVLIALTEAGVFLRQENADWQQLVAVAPPPEGMSKQWTKCTINQLLFFYQQGGEVVYVLDDIVDGSGIYMDIFNGMEGTPERVDTLVGAPVQLYSFKPTMINMAGQVGIFKAGGSLGFWDTDDAIAVSAVNDYTDFTPSLTSLANITKLLDQVGRIVTVLPHGNGIIVYCTRSIIYLIEDSKSLQRYRSDVIVSGVGIAYPREAVAAQPDTTHFAWTSMGMVLIEDGEATPIIPDFSDYVKRTRTPQYLSILNNRYLAISVIDENFITGNIELSKLTETPSVFSYPSVRAPGVTIPGTTIKGEQVCLEVIESEFPPDWSEDWENDWENDLPEGYEDRILEYGVKPYHVLQIYGQWLYKGASLWTRTITLGETELKVHKISPGDTDARYQALPVSMKAADVSHFNTTKQLEDLQARQQAIYESVYAESTLRLQSKWDGYLEARTDLHPRSEDNPEADPYLVDKGIVVVSFPAPEGDSWSNSDNPFSLDTWYDTEAGGPGARGNYIIDALGNMYVSYFDADYTIEPLQAVSRRSLLKDLPHRKDFLGFTEGYFHRTTAYQYVGKATLDIPYTPIHLDDWPHMKSIGINPTEVTVASRFEFQDKSEEGPYAVLHPDANSGYELYSVAGGKLATKLLPANSNGYELTLKRSESQQRLLRSVASKVRVTIDPGNIGSRAQDDPPMDVAMFKGDVWGMDHIGGEVLVTRSVSMPYSLQTTPGASAVFTSPIEAGAEEARDLMIEQSQAFFAAHEKKILDKLTLEWYQKVAQIESEINGFPGVGYIVWISLVNKPNGEDLGPGDPNRYQDDTTTPFLDYDYHFSDIEFPCLLVEEVLVEEEEKDFKEDLFGKVPAALPPTAVGAAAVNAMTDEDKRGLIAVHQYFYNNNRSKEKPDDSFLITAAGRVDVPLGATQAVADMSPYSFTSKARFANRYYRMRYEGAPPEGGWPEDTPTQDWEYGDPWPPSQDRGPKEVQRQLVCGVTEDINIPDLEVPPLFYPGWTITPPPITWALQNGSPAPYDPTFYGAYVYDLHLKKWGVFKGEFKHLIDYQPLSNYSPGSVPYENYLIDGGCLTPNLEVALFTETPADNYVRFGKYQHTAYEMCAIEEVTCNFRDKATGQLVVQASLDGRHLEYGLSEGTWFNDALSVNLNCSIVGQWMTVAVSGHYDLASMTINSHGTGRR